MEQSRVEKFERIKRARILMLCACYLVGPIFWIGLFFLVLKKEVFPDYVPELYLVYGLAFFLVCSLAIGMSLDRILLKKIKKRDDRIAEEE